MKPTMHLRAGLTELQAEGLHRRFSALPFKVNYQEQQRRRALSITIDCTAAQSKILRGILREVGVYGVITSAKGEQICAIYASIGAAYGAL